jgi:hypothetical protein
MGLKANLGNLLDGARHDLSLRSVGILGPVGWARGIENIGFFELRRRFKRRKL